MDRRATAVPRRYARDDDAARGRRNRPMDRPERPDQPEPESIFSSPDPPTSRRRHDLSRISRRPRSIHSTCRRGGRRPDRKSRPLDRCRASPVCSAADGGRPLAPNARRPWFRGSDRPCAGSASSPSRSSGAWRRDGARRRGRIAHPDSEPKRRTDDRRDPRAQRDGERLQSPRRPDRRSSWPWVTGRRSRRMSSRSGSRWRGPGVDLRADPWRGADGRRRSPDRERRELVSRCVPWWGGRLGVERLDRESLPDDPQSPGPDPLRRGRESRVRHRRWRPLNRARSSGSATLPSRATSST